MKKTLMMALLAMLTLAFSGCSDDEDDNGKGAAVTVENLKGYYLNTSFVSGGPFAFSAGQYGYWISDVTMGELGSFNVWRTYRKNSDGTFESMKTYFFKVQDGKILISEDMSFSSASKRTISLSSNGMTFSDPEFGTIKMKRVSSF